MEKYVVSNVWFQFSSLLQEEEFHKLADSTIHDLLEKLEVILDDEISDIC